MAAAQGPYLTVGGEACPAMRARVNNIHMVGIGGSGMNGIAEVLINMGFNITGSDLNASAAVRRLEQLGANVFIGHGADNVGDADVLIKSTAIPDKNPEIIEAKERGIPIIPPCRNAGRTHAPAYGRGCCRYPRQDDHHLPACDNFHRG